MDNQKIVVNNCATEPTIIELPKIEIPINEFNKLIEAQTELSLLKRALLFASYSDIDKIKDIFHIKKEE